MTTPRSETNFTFFAEEAEKDIFDTDTVYLFTLNPDPARYPTVKPSEQYKIVYDLFIAPAPKVFSTFAFTPELTDNGNIHIHGWYVIKDAVKYFKWWLPKCKQFGFTKVNKMKSKEALYYYKKDIELMNEIIDSGRPIPVTHQNIGAYKLIKKVNKTLKLIPHKTIVKTTIDKYFKK